jgi:hypothetical protein
MSFKLSKTIYPIHPSIPATLTSGAAQHKIYYKSINDDPAKECDLWQKSEALF